jgi:peptidoglycan hydrolase-like protein with peptidoglycan-binding domain
MPRRTAPFFAARFVLLSVAVSLIATSINVVGDAVSPTPADAADLSQFQPGNIISDALFFDPNAMTAGAIQSFLSAKVPTCVSGYTCLKDYTETTRSIPADPMCAAYTAAANETAATIIARIAQSCGISPKVILVMLQKEQGLITHTSPSAGRYRSAMGAGCPDTAACDSAYYGFFNQVRYGAYLLKRYTQPPGTGPGTAWTTRYDLMKPIGVVNQIQYHPNTACGTQGVLISNQATHSLYMYTPYVPNAAALSAGYGVGNACSAYGNRNFFQFYTDWFGSTQAAAPSSGEPTISGVQSVNSSLVVNVGAFRGPPTGITPSGRNSTRKYNGFNVMAIQWALNVGGIPTGIDGQYGSRTKANVRAYQRKFGLSADGRVGARTWAHMNALVHAPSTYGFAWFSCTAAVPSPSPTQPAGCTAISGATLSAFTPSTSSAGAYISARVSARNSAGTTVRWTASTGALVARPLNTSAPTITGSGAVGSVLTANPGTWTGYPIPALSYQWFSCTTSVTVPQSTQPTDCVAIDAATEATYSPVIGDTGAFVSVNVVATNSEYAASIWTSSIQITP